MKIVGATEYAVVLYRDKLPKFNNMGLDGKNHMIFNWFEWKRDNKKEYAKIHPTQKPVNVLKELIKIFTDEGDVVIDPVAGSASTLRACAELNRSCYGFEIKKDFYNKAKEQMISDEILEEIFNQKQVTIEELIKVQENKMEKDLDILEELIDYVNGKYVKEINQYKIGRAHV